MRAKLWKITWFRGPLQTDKIEIRREGKDRHSMRSKWTTSNRKIAEAAKMDEQPEKATWLAYNAGRHRPRTGRPEITEAYPNEAPEARVWSVSAAA